MPESPATSPQQVAAGAVCSSLHRAYGDQRLYPPGHPMAQESLEELAANVARYVERWGTLALEVREDALALNGEEVYLHEAGRANLAFLMFRDGLRTLSLHPACEVEEVEALADCLAHADDLANMGHNLVTALWERDLRHIDCHVVDPFLGGGVLHEGMVDALRETALSRLQMVQAPAVSPGDLSRVEMREVIARHVEGSSLQLTSQEIERGERAVEGLSSVLHDYAQVLLEIASKLTVTAASDMLIRSLAAVVGAFLDDEDVEAAMFVLERVGQLEAQRWCPAGSVGFIAGEAITAHRLRCLLEEIARASTDRAEETQRLLTSVRRWITPSLLEILTEDEDRAVRKTVLEILGGENAVPWRDLEPLLRDQRWYVVRNAVHLAADMGHEELADHASRLLGHPDVRVRREVVRALGRMNSHGAIRGLGQALSDQDPSVRTLAANAVGRNGGPQQQELLLVRIQDRNFTSLSPEEMEAFLGAYAELAQEKAVPLLNRSWRRSLFSPRPAAFRVAAVLALGRVRAPAARAALQAASKSDDPQIRRTAAEAVRHGASTASPDGS
jgi:hypothetical protein